MDVCMNGDANEMQLKPDPFFTPDDVIRAEKLVSDLLKDYKQAVWPFLKPVDPTELEGYSDIVEKPMDFETSKQSKLSFALFTKSVLLNTYLLHCTCVSGIRMAFETNNRLKVSKIDYQSLDSHYRVLFSTS